MCFGSKSTAAVGMDSKKSFGDFAATTAVAMPAPGKTQFEVFGGTEPDVPVTRFKLESTSEGGVRLVAVDKYGFTLRAGNILEINSAGKLYLNMSINESLGLRLDHVGRLLKD